MEKPLKKIKRIEMDAFLVVNYMTNGVLLSLDFSRISHLF